MTLVGYLFLFYVVWDLGRMRLPYTRDGIRNGSVRCNRGQDMLFGFFLSWCVWVWCLRPESFLQVIPPLDEDRLERVFAKLERAALKSSVRNKKKIKSSSSGNEGYAASFAQFEFDLAGLQAKDLLLYSPKELKRMHHAAHCAWNNTLLGFFLAQCGVCWLRMWFFIGKWRRACSRAAAVLDALGG